MANLFVWMEKMLSTTSVAANWMPRDVLICFIRRSSVEPQPKWNHRLFTLPKSAIILHSFFFFSFSILIRKTTGNDGEYDRNHQVYVFLIFDIGINFCSSTQSVALIHIYNCFREWKHQWHLLGPSEIEQDTIVLATPLHAPPHWVLFLPSVCGKTLAKE